jgi:hypothetical protein
MNRFAAAGLANEAASGRRVVVLSDTQQQAYGAMRHVWELVNESDDAPEVIKGWTSRGQERLLFAGGGHILFRSIQSRGLEGMQIDLLYLDHIRRREWIEKQYHIIRHVYARGGEVMES